jgi:short-subunit dehydrogenase
MDVSKAPDAMHQMRDLIDELQDVELIIISAGVGTLNPEMEWRHEAETMETNVTGFAAVANMAVQHFTQQGSGHLVGISSIAALRGGDASPAYYASKAFQSNYLQGLRKKMAKSHMPVTITEVQPGLVNTAMAQGEGLFWVAPVRKAARQIYDAISRKREHVYVTKRWRLIAWLIKFMPASLYNKM